MTFFERIGAFFASLPSEIYVFLISILPIIELRGSIPVGAALGMPFYSNYLLSVVGNLLPVPFILLFIPKVLDFLGRFKLFRPMVEWLHKKADKYSGRVLGENKEESHGTDSAEVAKIPERAVMSRAVFTALFLFVAIPLPGTGAWTGALVASLFSLPKKWSMLAITLGVLTSGVIVTLISYGVLGFLNFLV